MNDKKLMNPEERALAEMLEATAKQVDASPSFKNKLEKKIMNAHEPKVGFGFFSVKRIMSAAGWIIVLAAVTLMFIWVIRTIAHQPQPAAGDISYPNAETATPESTAFQNTFEYVVQNGDTCSSIANKYGTTIKEIVTLNNLPSTCPITVGQVLKIPIKTDSLVPPQINLNMPAPGNQLYNFGGLSLYLKTSLPESPAEVGVYLTLPDPLNTNESVLAVAEKFGIQGKIYLAPNQMRGESTSYLVTAGGPRLYISSDNHFEYYSNYGRENTVNGSISDEQAHTIIDDFMVSHNFNFRYKIERNYKENGSFNVIPLLEGSQIFYSRQLPAGLLVKIDNAGRIFSVTGILYSTNLLGKYPIRSAGDAFQFMLTSQAGTLASTQSATPNNYYVWPRIYPDNQKISIYGYVTANVSAEIGNQPFLAIDGYPLDGNTAGLEQIGPYTPVVVNGRFQVVNLIHQFTVENWKVSGAALTFIQNRLHMENGQVTITDKSNGNNYVLTNDLNRLPKSILEADNVGVSGFLLSDGSFEWKSIQYISGNQNGGITTMGSISIYKLNFTGTSIPLPSPFPTFAPLSTNEAGKLLYTVQPGDTFDSIAQKFNISIEALMRANGISEISVLRVGVGLVIPGISLEAATNQPNLINGSELNNETNADIVIEKAELVYFIADPRFGFSPAPYIEPIYIQPMWRFTGHHRNGNLVEILVQALKDEYLSPEIQIIQ